MPDQIPQLGNWIEGLEDRRLLSASAASSSAWYTAPVTSGWFMSPDVSTPNVVGSFTGTLIDTIERKPGTLTLQINSQSRRGVLMGVSTSKIPHEGNDVSDFTGKIVGDSITLNVASSDNVKIKGTISEKHHKDVISGTWMDTTGSNPEHGTFSVMLT
jgi:hypothetical protein